MLPNENFYISKNEPNRSCLLTLRDIILKHDDNVTETTKYGMPCFCFKNKMFCYLWVDKKTEEPYILFVEGEHLNHPDLEIGTRKRMKILRVNASQDIPINIIESLINDAIELYRNGSIRIK
ncbi:DUF1801 domain-containing protein [Algibacter sp. R77976]|uniref:DUF1801 domain-containing protein n=1 Tax=Algibacter sp. R77976 TaxID=3093873 RepID=UPI0037C501A7